MEEILRLVSYIEDSTFKVTTPEIAVEMLTTECLGTIPVCLVHGWVQCFARSSHKTFRIKQFLVNKQKQSLPIPHLIQIKTGSKIKYNSKRRHWRRTKLGL
ncbi:large ribosomal subunit protein eL39-like [Tamandua tetradactyla]|uniref:large ribosomal subunit protein eL39-like n=1 Tax=Tamandua tetradactyla TaxID=48850 RepID=UPI0040541F1D